MDRLKVHRQTKARLQIDRETEGRQIDGHKVEICGRDRQDEDREEGEEEESWAKEVWLGTSSRGLLRIYTG